MDFRRRVVKSLFLEDTPIEEYHIGKQKIFVKREDVFGVYPAPPLAKLRGARIVLQGLKEQGVKMVGVLDTRISKSGQGVSCICKELGMECWVGFPRLKNTPIGDTQVVAEELGAKLFPLKAGRIAILYAQFKKLIESNNGTMLPLGLTFPETVDAVESVSATIKNKFNSIVLSTGTGTIAAGIASGVRDTQTTVYGISCGMSTKRQWRRVNSLLKDKPSALLRLILISPEYDYYDYLDTSSCPFPTSPYYDMKAWAWLVRNINNIEKPVLFWNIGV